MKKQVFSAAVLTVAMLSGNAYAEGSIQHFGQSAQQVGQSATHSAGSIGNAIVGTTKLVSGVIALPLKGIGSIGEVSNKAGDVLWDNATGEEALEISEETVTVGPSPVVAMAN